MGQNHPHARREEPRARDRVSMRRDSLMNKLLLGLSAALIAGSAACVSAAPAVTGDYIEARSCNVYAGPCHFGSEYTTAGREAVMAWRVQRGASAGQTLDGLGAVAVVAGEE